MLIIRRSSPLNTWAISSRGYRSVTSHELKAEELALDDPPLVVSCRHSKILEKVHMRPVVDHMFLPPFRAVYIPIVDLEICSWPPGLEAECS